MRSDSTGETNMVDMGVGDDNTLEIGNGETVLCQRHVQRLPAFCGIEATVNEGWRGIERKR